MERNKYDMEQNVKLVSDMVNNMSFKDKEFAKLFAGEHRTLQQNFTRMCVAWLEQCAEQKKLGRYDLRNQDSVDLGEAFMEQLAEEKKAGRVDIEEAFMELDERKRYLSHV
jgi:heme oxygenase